MNPPGGMFATPPVTGPGTGTGSAIEGTGPVAITFVTRRSDLSERFPALARSLTPAGRLWIAWPKKAAGVRTDLDFDAVQRVGLDAGLVDNKSAAITETYQGLQFVVRTRDRSA